MIRKIIIGTASPLKIEAVGSLLNKFGLFHLVYTYAKVFSGVNEQPVGIEETLLGATNRALNAIAKIESKKKNDDIIGIGIESGLIYSDNIAFDVAVIVAIVSGHEPIYSLSPGIVLPADCVEEARQIGFNKATVGSVIATKFGGDKTDPHSILTNGVITRRDCLISGLRVIMAQIKIIIDNQPR